MGKAKKRICGLDLMKTIAIFFVIGAHVPLLKYDYFHSGNLVEFLLYILFQGVPLFLAINGFLLFGRKEIDLKKHYQKTLKIFLLFMFWSLALIIINLLYDRTPITRSLVVDLFFKTGGEGSLYTSELWFLQYLVPLYILYPILFLAYRKDERLFNLFFALVAFFTVGLKLLPLLASLLHNEIRAGIIINIYNFFKRSAFLGPNEYYVFYFMFGGMIRRYYQKLMDKRLVCIFAGLASWLLAFGYGYLANGVATSLLYYQFNETIFMAPIVLGWFALLSGAELKGAANSLCESIGSNTLGIYIIHSFIIRIVRLFIPMFGLYRFLITIVVLAISHVIVFAMGKMPGVKHLVSF